MSSKSVLMRKLVIAMRITKNKTPNNKGNCQMKMRKFCRKRAETPAGTRRTLRCRVRCSSIWQKFQPKFLISVGKLARLAARNAKGLGAITQITKSLDQNHKKRTQSRDRSETNLGLFMKFSDFWGKRDFVGRSLATKSC